MCKGVTAVQNVQTLKWLSATGIEVKWNFLYGVPGEQPADYEPLPALFAKLAHLVPPQAEGRVRIDRFSPYFEDPGAFGLPRPHPSPAYRHVYPFPDEALENLAYYFTTESEVAAKIPDTLATISGSPAEDLGCHGFCFENPWQSAPDTGSQSGTRGTHCRFRKDFELDPVSSRQSQNPQYLQPTLVALEAWRRTAGTVTLRATDIGGSRLVIFDTRPCARAFEHRLAGFERDLYTYCDTARSFRQIVRWAGEVTGESDESSLRQTLERGIEQALMIELDGLFLSLAFLPEPAPRVR